jgi:2'-5' RNA ligase
MKAVQSDSVYVLAHGFPTDTEMAKHVNHVIKMCSKEGIIGVPSKMGTHLTLLPPFYGNEESVRFASSILKVMTALLGNMHITVSGVGVFPPPDPSSNIEALHFKIDLPDQYHKHVEWLKTTDMFTWVHAPLQTSAVEPIYVPHVHIIEGENLSESIERCREEIRFMVSGKSFALPPPQFFKKDPQIKRWTQVTV